jgi:formylglycine-generating enzyme required for sulfatase activity
MAKDRHVPACDPLLVAASVLLVLLGCDAEASAPDAGAGGSTDAQGEQGDGGAGCVAAVGSNEATGDAPSSECPADLPGPALVNVRAPQGCTYCVDSTEVTNKQYSEFLAAEGTDTSGQGAECEWNNSYQAQTSLGDDYPVQVDWCDAFAYCKWAGKRLCGRIGGGSTPYGDRSTASASEWYNACSLGGTRTHPYGEYQGDRCNVASSGPLPVRSKPTCEGGYSGIFDMSGNVVEWEDSCWSTALAPNSNAANRCATRGGSWFALPGNYASFGTRCDFINTENRSVVPPEGQVGWPGVRCCSSSL